MTPAQCRMARAALKWSTTDLANAAAVNQTTINRFENGKDSYSSTSTKIREAFESTGQVRFEGVNGVFLVGGE